jgi:hypothetical protein
MQVNATIATAIECMSRVTHDFPDADAAEYSNVGEGWCLAVFGAKGVIAGVSQTMLPPAACYIHVPERRRANDTLMFL